MSKAHAELSALIPASPERVYAVLSDYRTTHPQILPRQYFSHLVVEEGGQGAGTVFRTKTHVLGQEQAYHMRVAEPEPGRTLVETDLHTGLTTTFTIDPAGDGRSARVRIATEWQPAPGLAGAIERLSTPFFMRRIYAAQFKQLAAHLAGKDVGTGVPG